MISNTRLYGAVIALTSGIYSIWSASTASRLGTSGWVMLVLGVVVVVHGVVLLTAFADRLGSSSGPLMIVYSVSMLLNQALLGAATMGDGSGMGMSPGTGMGSSPMTTGMGWDTGMAALALLMLASGLIMSRGSSMSGGSGGM